MSEFQKRTISEPRPLSRLVIFRLGSLGDTIIALPCFHRIAECFPAAERIVLTNRPVSAAAAPLASILQASGLVQSCIDYPVALRSPRALWSLRRRLAALGADTLVYLTRRQHVFEVRRDRMFFRLCGFTTIIGAPDRHDLLRNRRDPESGLVERESERLMRNLAVLGSPDLDDPRCWSLNLSPEERGAVDPVLAPLGRRPFLAIHMGGKFRENDWGEDNWRRLMASLALKELGLVVLGAEIDRPRAERVVKSWPGLSVVACGRLTPRQSAALLEQASLFVGHDSGPLHLASAVGCPWVGLFSALFPPRQWHPYRGRHRAFHRLEGIGAISVLEIAEAAAELLAAGSSA